MKPIDVLNLYPKHNYTLSSLLYSRTQHNPAKESLVFNKKSHSYDDFYKWVAGLGEKLASENLNAGDKVGIISRNSDLYVALFFALADIGCIAVPVNPDLNEKETAFILKHSEAKLLLVSEEFSSKPESVLEGTRCKRISLDKTFYSVRGESLQDKATENDPCLILYTSGTTGFPKGVIHSQKSTVMAGEAFVERMLLEPSDRMLCILPFFHINALFYSMMGSFAAGATLLVVEKFSASKFWDIAADLKATQVNIIAAIGNILAQRDRKEFNSRHNLKKIYGAPVSASIEKLFREEFNVPAVLEGYGMTEIPGAINNQLKGKWKVGTMGVAAKHPDASIAFTELKIIDENEKEVPAGESGELVVKTPLLMLGYYKDPEQTKESFTQDGYFKTGDLVKQDSEGFYVFVTRKKDIIRRRGENISGAEIDRCVSLHPKIAECAAIGVASALGEEEILLAIVPRDGEDLSEKEIYDWCLQHLSRVKCPRYIKKFKSLPHTPTARVAKFKLKMEKDVAKGAVDFA